MTPETSARLARIHMEATTDGAGYNLRRMRRRDRKAAVRVLVMVAIAAGYYAVRMVEA